ncbi:VacJ family lipoprotein [Legionella sp. W05-934-2]|uniref:MlaA family lipoprotein n=1 Tax=Legionella sp. W05-934-2 TaxID=1198649 RepID=UPI003461F748
MMHRCLALGLVVLSLTSCIKRGPNPQDPYESLNRETHKFNVAFDATILRPPARVYKAMVPGPIRGSIDNAYDNIHMLPTVANDILQAQWRDAIKDSWRFLINSTLGIAGFFDAATQMGLPPHSNDLGLTFAKWGDKNSPYIVIPFLGPSTIRDGAGSVFDFSVFMPYPYINNDALVYSLLGLRYIDLRSQLFETDQLIAEALDKYAFIRDAYLQNRNYRINGAIPVADAGSLYVDEEEVGDYIDDDTNNGKANHNNAKVEHDSRRTVSA